MNETYYRPSELTYNKSCILWLLKNLPELRKGEYPPNPAGSSYTDIPGKVRAKSGAYYQVVAEVAAEIDMRLSKCGLDGLILEAIESWGVSHERIAKALSMPVEEVIRRAYWALSYISSGRDMRWHTTKRRKSITYRDWVLKKIMEQNLGRV